MLFALFVASLAAQLVWARADASHAYYGTDARLYQLLAGVLLALVARTNWFRGHAHRAVMGLVAIVSLVGVVVVATEAVDLDPSRRGICAMVASVGVIAGLMGAPASLVARLLSRPAPVYLGRISYGTYLWHWPVVVIVLEVVSPSPLALALIAGMVSTGLAAVSYELVELPIRRGKVLITAPGAVFLLGLTISTVAAVLVVPQVLRQDARPAVALASAAVDTNPVAHERGPVPRIDWEAVSEDRGPDDTYCADGDTTSCVVSKVDGNSGDHLRVALIGDSQARMLAPALADLARKHGFELSLSVINACPWQPGIVSTDDHRAAWKLCPQVREEFWDHLIDDMDLDVVVAISMRRQGPLWEKSLALADGADGSLYEVFADSTERAVRRAEESGVQLVIIEETLLSTKDPLECLSAATDVSQCAVNVPLRTSWLDAISLTAAERSPNVSTANINPAICPAAPVCDAVLDGIPVWKDGHHYTPKVLRSRQDAIWAHLKRTGALNLALSRECD